MRKILLPLLLVLAGQGFAATGWISDELYVPLRAGEGNQYKILHRGLKSGTAVEILEQVEGSEWTKVRYGEIEGYINSQYVMKSPTADIRLAQMEKKYEQTREQLATAQTQLREVTAERDRLAGENKSLDNSLNARSNELDKLKEIAADPVRLDQANRKLNEELVQLRTQLDTAQAEIAMLRTDNRSSQWLIGCLILFAGALVGWMMKGRSSKSRSSWA